MKNGHLHFPFIMGGIALACFLAVVLLVQTAVQPPWGRVLVLLLPALILFGIGISGRAGILDAGKTTALTAGSSVVLFLLSVCYVLLLLVWTATMTTTDTKYYARAYRQISERGSVTACFPASIPEEATDVEFRYNPQFLQGGEEFRLSYHATEARLLEQMGKLPAAAEWSGANEEWYLMHNQSPRDPGLMRYQLFGEGFSNHGEEACVLVDPSVGRIEFCYSKW